MKYNEFFSNLNIESTEPNTTSKNSVDDHKPFFELSEDQNELLVAISNDSFDMSDSFDTSETINAINSNNNEVHVKWSIQNTIDDEEDNLDGDEFSIQESDPDNSKPDFDSCTCHSVKLNPCECPQNLGRKTLDAQTKVRVIKVTVTLKNICPNRPFGLVISAFIRKNHRDIGVGEICDIVCSRDWKCFKRTYNLVIAVPLCSDEVVYLEVLGNYVNCRNL